MDDDDDQIIVDNYNLINEDTFYDKKNAIIKSVTTETVTNT